MADKGPDLLSLSAVLAEEFRELHDQEVTLDGSEDKRRRTIFSKIHELPAMQKRTALCISGGGIRSATFALGVLQGLARKGFLKKFDYLSTVSGGGYVGSWLTAWIYHHSLASGATPQQTIQAIEDRLGDPTSEPPELKHLRAYSNYLDPRVGWFSADTWTLVATALRNMLLNWLVLVPLLAGGLLLPRFRVYLIWNGPGGEGFGLQFWLVHGTLVLGTLLAIFAIARVRSVIPSAQGPNKNSFDQIAFLRRVMAPLFVAASLISFSWAWHYEPYLCPWNWCRIKPEWPVLVIFGAAMHFFGWLAWIISRLKRSVASAGSYDAFGDLFAVLASGAVGGALLWVLVTHKPFADPRTNLYACLFTPVSLLVFLLANALYLGLSSFITNDEDREWWSRAGGWMLIGITANALVNILVIFGVHWLLVDAGRWIKSLGVGGISGLITVLMGMSGGTSAQEKDKKGSSSNILSTLLQAAPQLAAPVFALFLVLLLAAGTTWLISETGMAGQLRPANHLDILKNTSSLGLAGLLAGLLALAGGMSYFVNVNKFSLHAMYRNRLIRAYLGASRKPEDRRPDKFTGFDPLDNVRLHCLKKQKPFHVVNMALNVAGNSDLSWQERQAMSFTASPLHVGSHALCLLQGCYRRAQDYASHPAGRDGRGLTLGSAVTISGAAANPNMGYNSSPLVAFLMTLFNARLGAWLGNPAVQKDEPWKKSGPDWAAAPLLAEALALTTTDSAYVNLSDGGHFENMALYEMILRRCAFIMVLDDGREEDVEKYAFDDLAGAIRKVRIDFGIPIDIDITPLRKKEAHFVEGVIKYSEVDQLSNGNKAPDGRLIIVKPLLTGDEEVDIFNYAQSNPTFPQQSTADQWFDESQFESYRMLGYHTVVGPAQFPLPVSKPGMPVHTWP